MNYIFETIGNGVIFNGDCLEVMPDLIKQGIKITFCLTDLPYEVTANKADIKIPFDNMWNNLLPLCNDNTCIALWGQGIFYVDLVYSNRKMFKYDLVWNKILTSGFLNANKMPLRQHEQLAIFYKKQPIYNPQKFKRSKNHSKGKPKEYQNNNYGNMNFVDNTEKLGDLKHPTSIMTYSKPHPSIAVHRTQKSLECSEYLISTYTNEGDLVLDFTMGSGTTCVACQNLNRKFIGIELDKGYYEIAKQRIEESCKKRGIK